MPEVENHSGFAFEPIFLSNEAGQPVFVAVIKATFRIEEKCRLQLADEQTSVNLAGEPWGEPGESSWKYEPEGAFVKLASDVVLIGSAYAPYRGATEVDVRLRVGRVSKDVYVCGDRYWYQTLGTISMTSPEPIDCVPLIYELAYGGTDPFAPKGPQVFAANPVGTGFASPRGDAAVKLPNLEDPRNRIREFDDRPQPACFGYVSPDWQPRAAFAGTYDQKWLDERMPLLPLDFDRRFFNAASPGLIYPGFLRGDEPIFIENVADRAISLELPGLAPPNCHIEFAGGRNAELETHLDTLIINTDEDSLSLIWRSHIQLRTGPFDLHAICLGTCSRDKMLSLSHA